MELESSEAFGSSQRVFDLAFAPGDPGRLASAAEDGSARVWAHDAASGAWEQVRPCRRRGGCATRRIAVQAPLAYPGRAAGRLLTRRDPPRPRQVACCAGHTDEALRVAWAPDGGAIASGERGGAKTQRWR